MSVSVFVVVCFKTKNPVYKFKPKKEFRPLTPIKCAFVQRTFTKNLKSHFRKFNIFSLSVDVCESFEKSFYNLCVSTLKKNQYFRPHWIQCESGSSIYANEDPDPVPYPGF
jgi:hypothetical protein